MLEAPPDLATTGRLLGNLHRRIARIRQKRVAVTVAGGVALALTFFVGILTTECLLDWLTELPWFARACFLLGALAAGGFYLRRDVILPLRTRLPDDTIALMIERAHPSFRTRYIASIQLARTQQKSAFTRALVAYTDSLATTLDFGKVVSTAGTNRRLRWAFLTLLIAGSFAWWGGPATPRLLARAALLNPPVPRKTQFVKVTGDRILGVGEDFKIEVTAAGVLPARGTVIATLAKGQKREYPLEPDTTSGDAPRGQYSAMVRSVQESFTYVIKLNDATSATSKVTALVRPVIVQLTCQQVFPPYLRLAPVNRSPGDLKLLAGSVLKVSAKSSVPLSEASLLMSGTGTGQLAYNAVVDPRDPTLLRGEFTIPAKDLNGFSVQLVDKAGIASGPGALYRVDIVPDEAPSVKLTYPTRREELATASATSRIAFEAKDDYGLKEATLHYVIGEVGKAPEKTIAFEIGPNAGKAVNRRFEWKLTSITPKPQIGDTIEYWITVQDTNSVTGPGVGTTDHYQTRIVTEDEKRLDLANRLSDTMGGLGEVATSQELLNKQFGEIVTARPQR